MMNFENSCALYRIFLLFIGNDFKKSNLDAVGSINILITVFEMLLFNENIINYIKSNASIIQRSKMFEYFSNNLDDIEDKIDAFSKGNERKAEELKVRLYYSLMFFSFEIQNNMIMSIVYFEKLNIGYFKKFGAIYLPWISPSFYLDEVKVKQYGNVKIKEA